MKAIRNWFIKIIATKYLTGWLGSIYAKLEGWKTPLSAVLCVAVYVLELKGIIPAGIAEQLYPIIGTAGILSFLEKINRAKKEVEKFEEEIKK